MTTRGPCPPPAGNVETTEVMAWGVTANTRSGMMSVSRCSQRSRGSRLSVSGKAGASCPDATPPAARPQTAATTANPARTVMHTPDKAAGKLFAMPPKRKGLET